MKAQSSIISVVIIAGVIVAMVGAAYIWAVPMIEKRTTITDYTLAENLMLELNDRIVEIANTGSGEATVEIAAGTLEVRGYNFTGEGNNTVTLDFYVNQPLITEGGTIPIKTSSLDYIGEYGKARPRILTLSGFPEGGQTHLKMDMRYRELRSSAPKGYVIALCPPTGASCDARMSGGREVRLYYDHSAVEPRDQLEGGDLTVIYIGIEVS
jgi:hypothetical protein